MRRILAFVGLVVCLGTVQAKAEIIQRYSTGMWTITATTAEGRFDGCSATGQYGDGSVDFLLTRDFVWGIAITNPRWAWEKGSEGAVAYWVDSYGRFEGRASARSPTQLLIPLADSQQLFHQIRAGNTMYFEPKGAKGFSITLVGTSVALNELLSCVRRYRQ